MCVVPMIQNLESTLRSGAVPQVPQFTPPAAAAQPPVRKTSDSGLNKASKSVNSTVEAKAKAREAGNTSRNTAKPVASQDEKKAVAGDPMGDARIKVQEEITREFAAIMATGTLRASEAAALATRRVMEKHGRLTSPMN